MREVREHNGQVVLSADIAYPNFLLCGVPVVPAELTACHPP